MDTTIRARQRRAFGFRLETKLAASYLALGMFITLLSLFGGNFIQSQAARQRNYRAEVIRQTSELGVLVNSASEEGFSFVLMGDREERSRALSKIHAARIAVAHLPVETALTARERSAIDGVMRGVDRLHLAAVAMFEDRDRGLTASAIHYEAYEREIDGLTDELDGLRSIVVAESARDAARATRVANALTVLVGILSILLIAAIGRVLSRRMTRPMVALRDAAIAFGAGRLDAELPPASADEIGELTTAFAEMVQKRQRLEGELRQAQKMEAIGRLAGGVAHDFNNMLSIILGYTSVLLDGRNSNDPIFEPLTEVMRAGERSADLTRQLLAFSRQQAFKTQTHDVGTVVEDTLKMVRRVVGEDIEVSTSRTSEPCMAELAAGQLEQILMNLVVNARDAMPGGGKLEIDTREAILDETHPSGLEPGRYVLLSVRDNGTGMDERTKERIFEPFFTTKEQGKGTGLGLSTVFGIVHERGGQVLVDSQVGNGSCFRLYLPVANPRETETEAEAETPNPPVIMPAERTILLVEDEDPVRSLVERVLERKGYKVLAAAGGRSALDLAEKHLGTIDLLLTDVIMPGMNGRELAKELSALRPSMKILFMSGYTDTETLADVADDAEFLQKPITPNVLTQRVRGMLVSVPPPFVQQHKEPNT